MPRNRKSTALKGIEYLIKKFNITPEDFDFLGRLSDLENYQRIRLTQIADDTSFRNFWIYLNRKMTLVEILEMLEKASFSDPVYEDQNPIKISYPVGSLIKGGKDTYNLTFCQPDEKRKTKG